MLEKCSIPGPGVKGRNVVICCDGTGMEEGHSTGQTATPSNVKKIFNCVDTSTPDLAVEGENEEEKKNEEEKASSPHRHQVAYYERGVASVGSAVARASAGMTGFGMHKKITIMYFWLGSHWNEYDEEGEEDHLFLFGFSRGAFAVRSLMGMIYNVGLLDLRGLEAKEAFRRTDVAYYKGYVKRQERSIWAKGTRGKAEEQWKFFDGVDGHIPVHFLGVWDTVGQLGLPRESFCLWTLGLLCAFTPNKYGFHEVKVHPLVRTTRHALAIDEMRSTFQPVYDRSRRKEIENAGMDAKQVWFPGCHGNVGGGLLDCGLSDGALKWMVDEAAEKGLRFDEKLVAQIRPNYQGNIFYTHEVSIYRKLTSYPRSIPAIIPENVEGYSGNKLDVIHRSAVERSKNPPISDTPYFRHQPLEPGESHQVLIRANQTYNPTFVYMESGAKYKISAEGRWTGFGGRFCGPAGFSDSILGRPLKVNMAVGIGKCQRGIRKLSSNREANLPFTRRHDYFPWYSVMGMVASGGVRDNRAMAEFHQIIGIGEMTEYTVGEHGGYLYCYSNDAWGAYSKNRGNMEITIERLA